MKGVDILLAIGILGACMLVFSGLAESVAVEKRYAAERAYMIATTGYDVSMSDYLESLKVTNPTEFLKVQDAYNEIQLANPGVATWVFPTAGIMMFIGAITQLTRIFE